MKKLGMLGLLLLLCMSCFAGCAEEEAEAVIEVRGYVEGEQSKYTFEDGDLLLDFDCETTQFTLTQKSTGYVWASNPEGGGTDALATTAYKGALQSTLTLQYGVSTGALTTLNNYAYSIENGLYEIELLESGKGVKVKYSIGNISRTYTIPTAVPESRMLEFFNLMDNSGQRQVNEYYRKYDINNLRATDNRSELVGLYPDLETECVYVLREGIQEFLKGRLETLFEEVGYTYEDYLLDAERYSVTSKNEKPVFNVSIVYELVDGALVVSVPTDEIEYRSDYPIVNITPLPYFGAGGVEDTGYLLVPDGSGAIINFNNGKTQQSAYYNNVYGWDYGQNRTALIGENGAYFPVFAINNNGASMLCILEDGASVASIAADVSGRYHYYNYANATYTLLHSEDMDVSARSDKTVRVFEKKIAIGTIVQRYQFYDTSDYTELAFSYRDYLMEKYPSLQKNTDQSLPVTVDLIGAIDMVEQRMGIPVTVDMPLTTYDDALAIVKELDAGGIENLAVKYVGFANRGVTNKVPTSVKLISSLGGKKAFQSLVDYTKEVDIPLYLESYFTFAYRNSLFDGFTAMRDSARYVNREQAEQYKFWPAWFGEADDSEYLYYLVKPSYTQSLITSFLEGINDLGVNNIAFADIGKYLGADYNQKALVTREEALKMQAARLQELKENGTGVMLYSGNVYTAPYADRVLDMKLDTKGFLLCDEEVPFYLIALHGLVSYTGDAVNLAGDYEKNLLKSAETGAGLWFVVMNNSIADIQESEYRRYYGTDYSLWKDDIFSLYEQVQADYGHTFNQLITAYEKLADDVTMTTYEDGTRVVVNYTYADYVWEGKTIAARSYMADKGGE